MFGFLKKRQPKLFVIGLDCAVPQLVFERWRNELPNLNRLMSEGAYGELTSCTPCITVPAWSVMTSSKDPGVLGIYGFRNRSDHSYDRLMIATGTAVKEPRVWELLGQAGKRVVTIGVPGTYPPRPVNGAAIGCFLTPQTVIGNGQGAKKSATFTYPAELSQQVNAWAGGEYLVDVKQFRTDDKDFLLRQIYDMTRQHFRVVREMMHFQPWDFFMFVEMGTDRIHHGFWKYHDPTHPKYEPGNPYENSIREYYRYIDGEIGELLGMLDDSTAVIVVSDHGAKKMDGGICVNEWLIREGLLTLAGEYPAQPAALGKLKVDWSRTKVWGEGGYYARIFMNVRGREPRGAIAPEEYEREREALAERIKSVRGPGGEDIGTRVFKPQEIYRRVNGVAPDLIVYWGDLFWRSVGSIGYPEIWTFENDTGPDDANHAQQGMYIHWHPKKKSGGRALNGLQIMDVAPTVLKYFDLAVPADMQGHAIPLE
ncbi:MAG: alkaline phosphatase family protein [Ardenticatenaceae bacterium]|nr:alkaline phosphatase family protein [Ardenticatenaceae bacterium]